MEHPALVHLSAADPVLGRLIASMDDAALAVVVDPARGGRYPPVPPYAALTRIIIGQQVSVAAARSMTARLTERFGGALPAPAQVLADDLDELRTSCGLSRGKARFLAGLAEEVAAGRLDLDGLGALDDATVMSALVAVTGIGPWTAQVFLMGQLERPDVLAPGDVGIRRAAGIAYGLPVPPTAAELVAMAEPWRPHRSTACRLLWKSLDVSPLPA
ncbi:DNA-3-methyladenine glycosylase 2 family protein [Paraconexibacter sp. AEG42_29]|uniref:DNA-3-methyladenine glycosylase family protein n=1 Tax=Paraconexibacter sp. AEG42_29 TaxID=2997339 RepID=UPI00339D69B1